MMHFSHKTGVVLALLAGTLWTAYPAFASGPNLVKDGDFEQADPGQVFSTDSFAAGDTFDDYWTITEGQVGIDTANQYVFDGGKSLFLNNTDTDPTAITQGLTTVAGQNYTLSFYADADYDFSTLDVAFGSTELAPISVPNNGYNDADDNPGFTFYTFSVTASSSLTNLVFSTPDAIGINDGTLELDNITVTPAAVPEASTTVSFGLLMAFGLGGVLLRRKKARA